MNQSKIAVRYAKAFFNLAQKKKLLPDLKEDTQLIEQLAKENVDFILFLESPVIKTSQKIKLLNTIFSGKVNELTIKFLKLIAENKREIHIPGICRNFQELYRKAQGIKSAVITSAIPLRKEIIKQIQSTLESEFKTQVELSGQTKESLIGGFVLRIDDQQVDASLAKRLKMVKEELIKTEIN